jgi:hypothetical protein
MRAVSHSARWTEVRSIGGALAGISRSDRFEEKGMAMSESLSTLIVMLFQDKPGEGSAVGDGVSAPFGRHLLDPAREGQIELVGRLEHLRSFALPIPVSRRPAVVKGGIDRDLGDKEWGQSERESRPADTMPGFGGADDGVSEFGWPMSRLLEPVFPEHGADVLQSRGSPSWDEEARVRWPRETLAHPAFENSPYTLPASVSVGKGQQSTQVAAGDISPGQIVTTISRPGLAEVVDPRWVPMRGTGQDGGLSANWPRLVAHAAAETNRFSLALEEDGRRRMPSDPVAPVPTTDGLSGALGSVWPPNLATPGAVLPGGDDPGEVGGSSGFSAVPPPAMKRQPATNSDWSSGTSFADAAARLQGHGRVPRIEGNDVGTTRSADGQMAAAVQVNGGVSMDGRRLGQVSLTSQVRHASLPPAGQSRVNTRSAALFPGTRIPQ